MTKPIEGWVCWSEKHGVVPVIQEVFDENTSEERTEYRYEVYPERHTAEYESAITEVVRPVRITFTDEPNTEIADAVKKREEEIWEKLIEKGFVCRGELEYKRAIFGEGNEYQFI